MKRNLIAATLAAVGFAAGAAFAEPSLEIDVKDRFMNAPEVTSYLADEPAAGVRPTERDEFAPFNP
jgi:hypothetical protein